MSPLYEELVCCICGKPIIGFSNNPEGAIWKDKDGNIVKPTFTPDERCCDNCNTDYVIPGRLYRMRHQEEDK